MSYSKYYNPTNWENYPSEDTAINAARLNNIEDGVDTLDDRIVELSTDKSEVDWNQMLIAGRKIAEITINGITKDVLAPEGGGGGGGSTVTITPTISTGTKIADYVIDGYGGSLYAPNGGGGASALDDLTDVDLTTPSNGQVLKYDSVSSKWINATGGGGGGLLPHLYIDSEAGSTVTVVAPDSSVITPTQISSGHWECDVPSYGVYTIHAVLNGDDAVLSLTVDDVKEYHVTDSHYSYTLNVYAPTGSTIRVTATGETYTGTGAGSDPVQFALHQASTLYTITVTYDGLSRQDTITSSATTGGSGSKTIEFGTINLTVDEDLIGETIVMTNGTATKSKVADSTSMVFYPNATGNWTISCEYEGETYYSEPNPVVVSSLSTAVSAEISLVHIPEGATVTPTDDIQTWLACANITDKSYTTLAEVLADRETFETLIADSNACDYMARSTTWALAEGLVPTLTSDTGSNGYCIKSSISPGYYAYYVFDDDSSTVWYGSSNLNEYVGYHFDSPTVVNMVKFKSINASNIIRIKEYEIRGSNDGGTTWVKLAEGTYANNVHEEVVYIPDNTIAYSDIVVFGKNNYTSANYGIALEYVQFYSADITTSQEAMALIGKYDYCSNALLNNATWAEAIGNSDYFEEVLNVKVPVMTSATTPSGEVSASSANASYPAWRAFDGSDSSNGWYPSTDSYTNSYIQYKFTEPIKICKIGYYMKDNSSYSNTIKIEGSNNGTDFTLIKDDITFNSGSWKYDSFNNDDSYLYIRVTFKTSGITGAVTGLKLQFYGRASSNVSNINGIIHTAMGNESVYCVETGDTFTATDGIATVDFSDFDEGVYTFGSTTAKNPSDLSQDYTKQFRITKSPYGGTTELYLMPDAVKTLYWWGYEGTDLEDCSTANGWTSNYTIVAPVHNTGDIYLNASASNSFSAVAKSTIINNKTIKAIGKQTGGNSTGWIIALRNSKSLNDGSAIVGTSVTSMNTTELVTLQPQNNDYYLESGFGGQNRKGYLYALWYE